MTATMPSLIDVRVGRPDRSGVATNSGNDAVAKVPSASSPPRPHQQPATLPGWPQRRRQPRSRTPVPVTASDTHMPAAGLARPDALLVRLGELAPGDAGRVALRARAIEWYLPMTVYLARRFDGRGEPLADLTQVAVIGLIKAVDRYDANRGVEFVSYATPTILGEIKRHFRDMTWHVRVPRRLQELKLQLSPATEDLAHVLHRTPTTAEMATRLGVRHREVLAARHCASAYRPLSFEQPTPDTEDLRLVDSLGRPDPEIEAVDDRETIRVGLAELPERERHVITLRYFADMTQAQIAADIGVSQMQISRLLARSLTRLREAMLADADASLRAR
jgi:RNA polymerase sigma-B factor